MNTVKMEFEVPEEVVQYIGKDSKNYSKKMQQLFMYQLIQEDKISFGKAAEILGMDKMRFVSDLGKLGIPYFDSDIEEVMQDADTAEVLMEEKQ